MSAPLTPSLADKARNAEIYRDQRFSDHAPLIMDYDYDISQRGPAGS